MPLMRPQRPPSSPAARHVATVRATSAIRATQTLITVVGAKENLICTDTVVIALTGATTART